MVESDVTVDRHRHNQRNPLNIHASYMNSLNYKRIMNKEIIWLSIYLRIS